MEEERLLSPKDIEVCKKKADSTNQLAFGIMLTYFRKNIRFPSDESLISFRIISQVSLELKIDMSLILFFDWSGRNAKKYRSEIRKYLGYREATNADVPVFIDYVVDNLLYKNPSNGLLMEQIKLFFHKHKIEIFKEKQLDRHIISAKNKFEQDLFKEICNTLSEKELFLIDSILHASDSDTSGLSSLKKGASGTKIKDVESAIIRIKLLGKIKLRSSILKRVDRKLLLKYYDRIMALFPSNILEFNVEAKYATMIIFCHIKLELMLDSVVDMFTKILKRMRNNAEKYVDGYILKEVKRIDGKFDMLEKLASISVNNPDSLISEKIYPEIPKSILEELVLDLKQRGRWYKEQVQNKVHSTYIHGNRKTLLSIICILDMKEDHIDYKPILEAVRFIKKHFNSRSEYYINPPVLKDLVKITKDCGNKINKYHYEVLVLEELKKLLSFKGIWVRRSYRYRDPNEDIPKDFYKRIKYYCRFLDLPVSAKDFIKHAKQKATNHLSKLDNNILNNKMVKIIYSNIGKNIVITPSEAQKEPSNILSLQKEIVNKWSNINLIDVLKETDLRVNFTQQIEPITKSKSSIDARELRKRILLCIYAIGSNTGLKRISIANGDVNYSDLRYIKQRYINATNIRNSIRLVVNEIIKIRNTDIWGEATTSVACDSTQINAWDQNLINEYHNRYKGSGVMIYWHVDQKSLCIYSQLKSCSSSEVGAMIKGIIEHDTAMNMDQVFVDTHGQSVIGFGISYLLGFDLLPRLKGINKQKLYMVHNKDKEKYKNIAPILKGTINWKLIEDNYEEVVKHIAALKLGIVEPSVLIKRFSNNNYTHPVYKALLEIGKVNKTIFLCNYLNSEELRVEINAGLNVVERLNYMMDFIFYGKLGKLTTNNTDDQELSILCLHLLQVCVVYINTLMIQEILSLPHWQNKLTPEDYRALTPLISNHINPYGLFPMDLSERISINIEETQ